MILLIRNCRSILYNVSSLFSFHTWLLKKFDLLQNADEITAITGYAHLWEKIFHRWYHLLKIAGSKTGNTQIDFEFTSTKKETDVDVMVSTEKNFGESKKSWKAATISIKRSLFSQVYELGSKYSGHWILKERKEREIFQALI